MNDFLPAEYETPASGGNYARITDGENKFRILSKPILGWIGWKDKKPLRYPYGKKPDLVFDQPVKHFWAVIVWDYTDKAIKVLEITQATIQTAISDLSRSEHWGAPYEYDILITKSGRDKNTKYTVLPLGKKKAGDEIYKAALEKPVYLDNMLINQDPFVIKDKQTEVQISDLPF